MILKASQRGGGVQLAAHLLNSRDNDHVTVHEMRGFVARDLVGAFKEAYAASLGTRCLQYLFSVSLNPPEHEAVPINAFEEAISDIEKRMGLAGQPRAVLFHEKNGRRHAHCVWSRIDARKMKAVHLPHFKLKLRDLSRQLYRRFGWKMPKGLENEQDGDSLSFSLSEWQQAKRINKDPRTIRQVFLECWAASDSRTSFAAALKQHGYHLCRGDRRGHVAFDPESREVLAISRLVGVRAKEARAKLGDPDDLPSIADVQSRLAERVATEPHTDPDDALRQRQHEEAFLARKRDLVLAQRAEREALRQRQSQRRLAEAKRRAARLPNGLKAIWYRLTGRLRTIRDRNEADARAGQTRDRREKDTLIAKQLQARRAINRSLDNIYINAIPVRRSKSQPVVSERQQISPISHTHKRPSI